MIKSNIVLAVSHVGSNYEKAFGDNIYFILFFYDENIIYSKLVTLKSQKRLEGFLFSKLSISYVNFCIS